MGRPSKQQKEKVKCRGWQALCDCIHAKYPALKIKGKPLKYRNLKKFLCSKGLIDGGSGEPSGESREAKWMNADYTTILSHDGTVHDVNWALEVTEYGFDKIVGLLKGEKVKSPQERKIPMMPELTIEQKEELEELQAEIKSNIKNYIIVGADLLAIKNLFRIKGKLFKEYVQKQFDFDYRRALQFVKAVETISPICKVEPDELKLNFGSLFKGRDKLKPDDHHLKSLRKNLRLDKKDASEGIVHVPAYARRVLEIFDSERKVRAIEGLTRLQQNDLVKELLRDGKSTEHDIKRYAEKYRSGTHVISQSEPEAQQKKLADEVLQDGHDIKSYIAGYKPDIHVISQAISQIESEAQETQSDLKSILSKLNTLASANGNDRKWQLAIKAIEALIDERPDKAEDEEKVPF